MSSWTFAVRRVKNKPNFFKGNRVSSALFKDAKGVSVNKDDAREIADIVQDEERLHKLYYGDYLKEVKDLKLKALISLDKEVIEEKDIIVEDDPLEENTHHAVLKKSETTIRLTDSQAKALAKNSKFIKKYE